MCLSTFWPTQEYIIRNEKKKEYIIRGEKRKKTQNNLHHSHSDPYGIPCCFPVA
jgi:hypothetical protein